MKFNTLTLRSTALVAAAFAVMGTSAFAWQADAPITKAEAMEMAAERFDKADVDGDGILNAEEMMAGKKKAHAMKDGHGKKDRSKHRDIFTMIDADGSGDLSPEEFVKAAERMDKHRIKKGDTEQEGKIKLSPAERFVELDLDQNGALSIEEFKPGKRHGKAEDK